VTWNRRHILLIRAAAAALLLLAATQGCRQDSTARLAGCDGFPFGAPASQFAAITFDQDRTTGGTRVLIDEDHEYEIDGASWPCRLTLRFFNDELRAVSFEFGGLKAEERAILFRAIKSRLLARNPGLMPTSRVLEPNPALIDSMGYLNLRDADGREATLTCGFEAFFLEYSFQP
jgi:hypothetical protein